MVALLDVNVLVALFDPVHTHHEAAHRWFESKGPSGWASCPITGNGFVRVLSNPRYPGRWTTAQDAVDRLRRFQQTDEHRFWPDSVSICDVSLFQFAQFGGHRKLTDIYLLALAVQNGGRLATFDRAIPLSAVRSAGKEHLEVLG